MLKCQNCGNTEDWFRADVDVYKVDSNNEVRGGVWTEDSLWWECRKCGKRYTIAPEG